MTQLVQLQKVADQFASNGVGLFAISNDTVEILDDFATRHGITFPLLSDADSAVIDAFGIRNQLIAPDEGRSMRWHGIPYPGTYRLDGAGVVTDKDFHQHHARRASGVSVLAWALGHEIESVADSRVSAPVDDLAITVGLSDPSLRLEMISRLIVDIGVPAGQHVYAPGAPEAYTPIDIEVRAEGLRIGEVAWPDPTTLTMADLDAAVPVFDGRLRVAIPITATSELIRLGHDIEHEHVDIDVSVTYQTCDEFECGLPQHAIVTVPAPLERLVEPEGLQIYAQRVEAIEADTGSSVT